MASRNRRGDTGKRGGGWEETGRRGDGGRDEEPRFCCKIRSNTELASSSDVT